MNMRQLKNTLRAASAFGQRFFGIGEEPIRFTGDFSTWEEARRHTEGYDDAAILERVSRASQLVLQGKAAYERDGVAFARVDYVWPLLASLLWVAGQCGSRLRLIDFGGALGSAYFQHRAMLAHLAELRWCVVEQPAFVDCGRREFANNQLFFFESIDACRQETQPDVIVLSSVLPYLSAPYRFLEEVCSFNIPYLFIDRTPVLPHGPDRLTIQRIPERIYRASYPAWFFDESHLHRALEPFYEVVAGFNSFESFRLDDGTMTVSKGLLCRLRSQGFRS